MGDTKGGNSGMAELFKEIMSAVNPRPEGQEEAMGEGSPEGTGAVFSLPANFLNQDLDMDAIWPGSLSGIPEEYKTSPFYFIHGANGELTMLVPDEMDQFMKSESEGPNGPMRTESPNPATRSQQGGYNTLDSGIRTAPDQESLTCPGKRGIEESAAVDENEAPRYLDLETQRISGPDGQDLGANFELVSGLVNQLQANNANCSVQMNFASSQDGSGSSTLSSIVVQPFSGTNNPAVPNLENRFLTANNESQRTAQQPYSHVSDVKNRNSQLNSLLQGASGSHAKFVGSDGQVGPEESSSVPNSGYEMSPELSKLFASKIEEGSKSVSEATSLPPWVNFASRKRVASPINQLADQQRASHIPKQSSSFVVPNNSVNVGSRQVRRPVDSWEGSAFSGDKENRGTRFTTGQRYAKNRSSGSTRPTSEMSDSELVVYGNQLLQEKCILKSTVDLLLRRQAELKAKNARLIGVARQGGLGELLKKHGYGKFSDDNSIS